MSVIEETDIDLGFIEKTDSWKMSSKFFPSKIGGYPAWLDLKNLATYEELLCQMCHIPMSFLCQIYAPIIDNEDCFHRTIFMFVCRDGNCNSENQSSNMKVFRSQLPRDNPFYSFDAPVEVDDGNNGPTAADYSKLCIVCGALGPKLCGVCKSVSYCSREHQVVDWKAGHKTICHQSGSRSKCFVNNITFPEFEIDMEVEEIEKDLKSEKDRLEEYEDIIKSDNIVFQNKNSETDTLTAAALEESDTQFSIFHKTVNRYPDQVIRYQRGGIPLWVSSENKLNNIAPCSYCGGKREFEFQVMPQLLIHLNIETTQKSLDWGTLLVYTCTSSCQITGYAEEFIYKQDFSTTCDFK